MSTIERRPRIHRLGARAATAVLLVLGALAVVPALAAPASAATVQKLTSYFATALPSVMSNPAAVAYDATNNRVYVVGYDSTAATTEVVAIDPATNTKVGSAINIGSADSTTSMLSSIAVDGAGGRLFVVYGDGGIGDVHLSTGAVTLLTGGAGGPSHPQDVAWDSQNSTLYVSDFFSGLYFTQLSGDSPLWGGGTAGTQGPYTLTVDATGGHVYGNHGTSFDDVRTSTSSVSTVQSPKADTGDMGVAFDPSSGRTYYEQLDSSSSEALAYFTQHPTGTYTFGASNVVLRTNPTGGVLNHAMVDPGFAYFAPYSTGTAGGNSVVPVDLVANKALPAVTLGGDGNGLSGTVDTANHVAYLVGSAGVQVLTPHYTTQSMTTTVLTYSPSAPKTNQTVTFSAKVSPAPSSGTMAFAITSFPGDYCAAQPIDPSTGVATCTAGWSDPIPVQATATFSGGGAYAGSTSNTTSFTVASAAPNPTVTELGRSGPGTGNLTVSPGQKVTFTAVVIGATANGNPGLVDFIDGKSLTVIPTCLGMPLHSDGHGLMEATCTQTWTKSGPHYVFAQYRDDWGPDARSRSGTLIVTVKPFATTLTLTAPKSIRLGSITTFSGKVSPVRPGTVALQELVHGHWKTVASGRATAHGAYSIRFRVTAHTSWRTYLAADATHAAGTSKVLKR